jgi:hypothetical protein
VRVDLVDPPSRVVGQVVRVSRDTLVIRQEDDAHDELVIPAANVVRVEVSRGRRSHWGAGAVLGLLAGILAGSVIIPSICEDCVGVGLFVFPAGGAVIGFGLGAGVGALIRTERWQEVSWR